MFSRIAPQSRAMLQGLAVRATVAPVAPVTVPARGMATLKDLKLRINSTRNIQKITKSMKMIASTKLIRAQRSMEKARVYGRASNSFFEKAGVKTTAGAKPLYIAVSSDKGLCGGVHSSITRYLKPIAAANPDTVLVSLGDKCKVQLARLHSNKIVATFASLGGKSPTYHEALLITDLLLRNLPETSSVNLAFNTFQSAIAYETTIQPVFNAADLAAAERIDAYEIEDDVLQSFQEFSFANSLYWTMNEGYASEVAAKMAAMDNATRNAGDLISKLTIVYNRTRQAAITTELVDIITGASAL